MLKSIVTAMLFACTSAMKLKGLQREELNGETVKRVEDHGKSVEITDKSFRVPVQVVSSGQQFMIKLENLQDVDFLIVTECTLVLKDLIDKAQIQIIQEELRNKEHSKLHYLAQALGQSGGLRAVGHLQLIVKECTVEDGRQEYVAELFWDTINMLTDGWRHWDKSFECEDLIEKADQHFRRGRPMKLKGLQREALNGETVRRLRTYGSNIEIPDKSFRIPLEVVSSGKQISVKLENLEDIEPPIVTECAVMLKERINDAQIRILYEESQDKEHSKLHHLAQTLAKSGGVEHLKDLVKHCSIEDGRQKCVIALFDDIDGFEIIQDAKRGAAGK